jgi:hypothetical protein
MTKTHVIDGVTYVEAVRKAEVGDKIIIVNAGWSYDLYGNGDILTVDDYSSNGVYVNKVATDGNMNGLILKSEYRVLDPIANETPSVTDLLANLARRVASLESQLRDTQSNVEKLAEELANTKHLADSNEQDIAMLDERTQPQSVEVVTFEKFLDSVTEDVAKKLAEKVSSDLRTEMRLKALRGF